LRPVTEQLAPEPIRPPGTVIPLSELPSDHPAREYVAARGFDADALTANFNVGLCISVDAPKLYTARGRLYIPVTYRQELVGWQCRAIAPNVEPKYFNAPGMKKSALLYNYDQAQSQPYVIVVEGVPSVWRLGKAAVCLFGKTMSYQQQKLIARTWAGKPVFLLLDHDAKHELDRATTTLSNMSVNVVPVELPDERDPADYSSADIGDLLAARASAAGVSSAMNI
jgi:DNA primase